MINLSPELLATFRERGAWAGLPLLAADRVQKAEKRLFEASPLDVVAISKAQQEIQCWKDIGNIHEKVLEYAEPKS